MTARSFCTTTASTKRNVDLGQGRTGEAVEYLATLAITPLWPVSNVTRHMLGLEGSMRELKEAYHVPLEGDALPDVKEGDILVVNSREYPIEHAYEWTDADVPTLMIICQEVKNAS